MMNKHANQYDFLRKLGASLVLVCALATAAWSATPYTPQHPDPIREPWRWQAYPELDGLGLQCLARGHDGAMWFGVNDGVMQYDGLNWTMYTAKEGLVGSPTNEIYVTRTGDVYAGSAAGISRFDGQRWARVFPREGDLPWSVYQLIETQEGHLWVGTAWGALHILGDDAVLYTTAEMARVLALLAPWLPCRIVPETATVMRSWRKGTGMRVVEGFAPTSAVVWTVAPRGPADLAGIEVGDRITAVNHHPRVTNNQIDGEIGSQVTLSVFRIGRPDTFDVVLTCGELGGAFQEFHVYSVFEDHDRNLWFGLGTRLHGGEMARWQAGRAFGAPEAWRVFSEADGFLPGARPLIAETEDHHLWVVNAGTQIGAQAFDGTTWRQFSFLDLDRSRGIMGPAAWANTHSAIGQLRDGTLWIGGNGGRLHVGQDGQWTPFAFPDVPIPQVRIVGFAEDAQGGVWLGGLAKQAARLDYGSAHWKGYAGLRYFCEGPDGKMWFIAQSKQVVSFDGQNWTAYGVEDGLLENPEALFSSRSGAIWAFGDHHSQAATAQFEDGRWVNLTVGFANSLYPGAVFEAQNGDLWLGLGGAKDNSSSAHAGGVLQFDGVRWHHHPPPQTPYYVYAIGQADDGSIWLGGSSLRRYDGQQWSSIVGPQELLRWGTSGTVQVIHCDTDGNIWLGTRGYGMFRFDGQNWTRHNVQTGVADNTIRAIAQTQDGSIWAATDKGISRFDGTSWTRHALPEALTPVAENGLRIARDGSVWINRERTFETVHYVPDTNPPETRIVESVDEVAQPGNVTMAWMGADLWSYTAQADLQFAWRLDGGAWSDFAARTQKTLLEVPGGTHVFEVKARDRDFNEDPTPARVVFFVLPPIWQQPWFLGLIAVLLGAVGVQTRRVIKRDRRLRVANVALSEQNRELAEARASAEAASESKSAFLANMSHEIRTPLNAILGYARLLLRRDELGADVRQSVGTIESSGTHLLALINNILDLSRIESGRLELDQTDFDLQALLQDIGAMFLGSCQEKGIDWQVGWQNAEGNEVDAPGRLDAYGDVPKLRQVLINLVGNALKFAPGGQVRLRVMRLHDADDPGDPHRYRFEVSDTGQGIHPDDQAAIFEPFEQGRHGARTGGTGLGLAIARRYIQLMGGELMLESEVARGSRFFFSIPLEPAVHAQGGGRAEHTKRVDRLNDGHTLDALIVDDVAENRNMLSQVLTAVGATVRTASNGYEALAAVAERRPQVVLMDIWMPEMDGQVATRQIKNTYGPDAPVVIAVSASVLAHERQQFQASGFDDFIAKPVHEGQLFASMARLLRLEYVYQEDVPTSLNLDAVVLPEDLYANLRQAAEFGEVTQLEKLVDEVRALGGSAEPLADRLWRLSRRLELDAILKLLDEVRHGE